MKAKRHHSPEHRAKISAALKGRIFSPETHTKMSAGQKGMRRSPQTAAHRAKISAALKGRIASPEARARMSAAQRKPETYAKLLARRSQQVTPLKDTKPEVAVQTLLRDCGIEFAKHRHIPGLNHQWDIKIESKKTLIEVDGCYWHGCQICKLPKARIKQSDIPCTAFAVAAGWTVIRIRECEIKAGDFSKLKNMLRDMLETGEPADAQ